MASRRKRKPDWSTLPLELLTSIVDRLPTRLDILRYRAVCHSFRSASVAPPPEYSYIHLRIPVAFPRKPQLEYAPLLLKKSTFYAIEPLTKVSGAQSWVLRVEESDRAISVVHPFHKESYLDVRNKLPRTLNLLDYLVKDLGKLYELGYNSTYGLRLEKAVISDDGSSVMGIIAGDEFIAWRNRDKDWKQIKVDNGSGILGFTSSDIIYHNEKFYAISLGDVLITVDPESLDVTKIGSIPVEISHRYKKYLVKSSNDMFLVITYLKPRCITLRTTNTRGGEKYCFIGIDILKFDEEKKRFVSAKYAFNDRVMIVGDDFVFIVPAKESSGLRRYGVYLDDLGSNIHRGLNGRVFYFEKNTGRAICASPDSLSWPPPTWLKPSTSRSSHGGM